MTVDFISSTRLNFFSSSQNSSKSNQENKLEIERKIDMTISQENDFKHNV